METILKSLAIGLSLITGLQAMEVESKDVEGGNLIPQGQEAKKMTPKEENVYKMWLLKQHFEKSNSEETLPEVPRDIQTVIGQTLHDLCGNPVLDGDLVYTDKGNKTSFKIRDLLKEDGCSDLSKKEVFGDSSKYLLITTDPEAFFRIVENGQRLVILIAPKFLIDEKIESSAKQLDPIRAKWIGESAPIGIFYRMEYWTNLKLYDYLTSANIMSISKNNLYENWRGSCDSAVVCGHRNQNLRYTCIAKNFMFVLT